MRWRRRQARGRRGGVTEDSGGVGKLNFSAPAHGGQIEMNISPGLLNLIVSVTDNTDFYVKYDVQVLVTGSFKKNCRPLVHSLFLSESLFFFFNLKRKSIFNCISMSEILVPLPGIELVAPALEAQS